MNRLEVYWELLCDEYLWLIVNDVLQKLNTKFNGFLKFKFLTILKNSKI